MIAPPAIAAKDAPAIENVTDADSNEHDMRVLEWLIAGVALLATVLLAFPK